MAKVLANLKKRASYGLDEVSYHFNYFEINRKLIKYEIKPEDFGLKRGKLADIVGEDGKGNAAITRGILGSRVQLGCGNSKRALKMIDSAKKLEELVELPNRG